MAQSVPISEMMPHQGSTIVTKCLTTQPAPITICEKKEIACVEKPVCGPVCHFRPVNWCMCIIWFIVIAIIVWFILYLTNPRFIQKKKKVCGERGGREDDCEKSCGFENFDWSRMILATLVITAIIMIFIYLFNGCGFC